MLKEKIAETQNEITTITSQLAKLATSAPTPVLRLKQKDTSRRDTSSFTVIDNTAQTAKKKNVNSTQFMSSIGSVMDSLKSGKNHSYDDVEAPKPVVTATPVAMNPATNRLPKPRALSVAYSAPRIFSTRSLSSRPPNESYTRKIESTTVVNAVAAAAPEPPAQRPRPHARGGGLPSQFRRLTAPDAQDRAATVLLRHPDLLDPVATLHRDDLYYLLDVEACDRPAA